MYVYMVSYNLKLSFSYDLKKNKYEVYFRFL